MAVVLSVRSLFEKRHLSNVAAPYSPLSPVSFEYKLFKIASVSPRSSYKHLLFNQTLYFWVLQAKICFSDYEERDISAFILLQYVKFLKDQ